MTPENFCYWLQGFMEIQEPTTIGADKVQVIKDHLQLVFKKETPTYRGLGLNPSTWPDRGSVIYPNQMSLYDAPQGSC
jgi:hypothetical protein